MQQKKEGIKIAAKMTQAKRRRTPGGVSGRRDAARDLSVLHYGLVLGLIGC